MFQPLKSLLHTVSRRRGIEEGVRASVVVDSARDVLGTLFPSEVAARIGVRSFREGVLALEVPSAPLVQEVRMRSATIIRLLDERFGSSLVSRIRIDFVRPRQEEGGMLR